MKVSKAIGDLTSLHKLLTEGTDKAFLDALKLGIEALKRIKDRRAIMLSWEDTPLPGETPEEDRHADH